MPIPFLLAGAAAVAGTAGAIKSLEALDNYEQAKQLVDEANSRVETAKTNFELQKSNASRNLNDLGDIKIKAWSSDINGFVDEFSYFKNIRLENKLIIDSNVANQLETPKQLYHEIQKGAKTANEIAKVGTAAIGAGAVVGVAAYGGAMLLGTASTGTAISALSGAAAKNATLAWFGGGSLAAGGMGMKAGRLLLGGIAVAPVLAVAGFVMSAKSKEQLAQARYIHAEALKSAGELDVLTEYLKGISSISTTYNEFIKSFSRRFKPFLKALNRIRKKRLSAGLSLEYDELTKSEQQTLHLSWLMVQIYYQLLCSPILDSEGNVDKSAVPALENAQYAFEQLKKDTYEMDGSLKDAASILWGKPARKMMIYCFIMMGFLIAVGTSTIPKKVMQGLLLYADAFVSCPIFFVFKNLGPGKLYTWRKIRLISSAILLVIIIVFLY